VYVYQYMQSAVMFACFTSCECVDVYLRTGHWIFKWIHYLLNYCQLSVSSDLSALILSMSAKQKHYYDS